MKSYTKEFFVESGRKGGQKTLKKWGKKHLRAIASRGGKSSVKQKRRVVDK